MKKIPLSKGYYTLIDDEDYELTTRYKWHASIKVFKNGRLYVRAAARIWNKETKQYQQWHLHKWILRPPKGMVVDHINGDPLDNRRSNLRVTTQSNNIFNKQPAGGTSKFRGVSWDKQRNKWKSVITKNGKQIQLGRFDTEKEAALAYNEKAKELFELVEPWLNVM